MGAVRVDRQLALIPCLDPAGMHEQGVTDHRLRASAFSPRSRRYSIAAVLVGLTCWVAIQTAMR